METIVISDSGAYVSRAVFPEAVEQAVKINEMQYIMDAAFDFLFMFFFGSLLNSICQRIVLHFMFPQF